MLLDKRTQGLVNDYVPTGEILDDLVCFFTIFSDYTRLKMISALAISEMCVSDLARVLKLNQTTVSHQLRLLKNLNAVTTKRQGKVVFYSLRNETLNDVLLKGVRREGIYSDIADGTKRMAAKYGGEDFAINSKGLELASYEPRRSVGMGLGYAVANRGGCHLNGGYLALLESVGVLSMDALTPKGKAQFTAFMQDALEAVSSAGCCLFSAQTFVPGVFFKLGPNSAVTRLVGKVMPHMGPMVALLLNITPVIAFNSLLLLPHAEALRRATGLRMFTGSFLDLGERSYNLERLYNLREGLTAKDDSLPKRLTRDLQDPSNERTRVPLEKMLPIYYKVRGWDRDGRPTKRKLRRLGIEEAAK